MDNNDKVLIIIAISAIVTLFCYCCKIKSNENCQQSVSELKREFLLPEGSYKDLDVSTTGFTDSQVRLLEFIDQGNPGNRIDTAMQFTDSVKIQDLLNNIAFYDHLYGVFSHCEPVCGAIFSMAVSAQLGYMVNSQIYKTPQEKINSSEIKAIRRQIDSGADPYKCLVKLKKSYQLSLATTDKASLTVNSAYLYDRLLDRMAVLVASATTIYLDHSLTISSLEKYNKTLEILFYQKNLRLKDKELLDAILIACNKQQMKIQDNVYTVSLNPDSKLIALARLLCVQNSGFNVHFDVFKGKYNTCKPRT